MGLRVNDSELGILKSFNVVSGCSHSSSSTTLLTGSEHQKALLFGGMNGQFFLLFRSS